MPDNPLENWGNWQRALPGNRRGVPVSPMFREYLAHRPKPSTTIHDPDHAAKLDTIIAGAGQRIASVLVCAYVMQLSYRRAAIFLSAADPDLQCSKSTYENWLRESKAYVAKAIDGWTDGR